MAQEKPSQDNEQVLLQPRNPRRSAQMPEAGRRTPVTYYPTYEPLTETVDRVTKQIVERTGEPDLKTGLEVFDKGIFGLHPTQLTVLAARAGMGKTSMACQIAFELADQHKEVAYVSLEMSRESIISKLFCNKFSVDSFRFLTHRPSPEILEKLGAFRKLVAEMPLRIIDDYCFTQDELYTLIDHLEYRPQVLILDHLQHIRAIGGRSSEREILTEYLRFLKEIAMRHKIAVLCLSQINREGDDVPSLKTLKGTGAVEEMSDHVLLLQVKREKNEFESKRPELENAMVDIAKNRFGMTGYFEVLFEGKYGRFKNLERYRPENYMEKTAGDEA